MVSSPRLRKALSAALVWGKVLLATWIVAGIFLYVVVPAMDQPERADAIVVLAPILNTGRLEYAEKLMSEGYATTLVVSMPDHASDKGSEDICSASRPYRVICFNPDPVTTQGEAKAIKRLSDQYSWNSVTVVTNDFHVARARTLIERCYSKQLYMAPVRSDRTLVGWVYRFVYESAAFVKVGVQEDC